MLRLSHVAAVLALVFCENVSAETSNSNHNIPNHLSDMLSIRALIIPVRRLTLSSRIAAQIQAISVKEGGRFKQGQHLVIFECTMLDAQHEKALAEQRAATNTHEVHLKMASYQSISELDVAISASRVEQAKAEVAIIQAQRQYCFIKAPFAGRLIKRNVEPFESVSIGDELVELLDDSNLLLELFIPSHWLQWIKIGMSFSIHVDETEKTYQARILSLGAAIDPVSQTLKIRAEFNQKHAALLAGMSGTAFFSAAKNTQSGLLDSD